ncbi:MAG: alpha/beta hydrolase [Planctomycetia bacterium]|nr:alpha/beta hydrolase [Planctomycetia bacterium]
MHKTLIALLIVLMFVVRASARPEVIPVWPKLNVSAAQRAGHSFIRRNKGCIILHPVLWPTLTLFPASENITNGCAIVICAGGGYGVEAVSLEGYRVARWFNKLGVSCYVLKYRLPQQKLPPSGVPWPLQDVRRAVQIIRAHAVQWHINPHAVGVMGFSAGGSVASLAGVHWKPGNPQARQALDHISTRPDFLVLGYPTISMMPGIANLGTRRNLLGRHPPLDVEEYFSSELNVTPLTPPAFIFYAHDDTTVNHQNEKRFYTALLRNGVPAELVEFKHGKHGFGLGAKGTDSTRWPQDCVRWLKKMNFIASHTRKRGS